MRRSINRQWRINRSWDALESAGAHDTEIGEVATWLT
jgi:hypothetical protein